MFFSIRCQVNLFHVSQNLLISGRPANRAIVPNWGICRSKHYTILKPCSLLRRKQGYIYTYFLCRTEWDDLNLAVFRVPQHNLLAGKVYMLILDVPHRDSPTTAV